VSCWLVTGAGGMLGLDLMASLEREGETAFGLTRRDLDISRGHAVTRALRDYRPDIVVNCAAWTGVDDAETSEDEALLVNGIGARLVATACSATGTRMVHISTDYVFGGNARRPYDENDVTGPSTAYGRTKLAGERAVRDLLPAAGFVVRTAWLYGANGPNFVRTLIGLEAERDTVDVVDDQIGQPTWTLDVADQIIALARSHAKAGIYHATSSGQTSWCGLASEIFRLLGADPRRVRPINSRAYPRPASRPSYSVLGHGAWAGTGIEPIPDWRLRLQRAFRVLVPSDRRLAIDS